ncbi:MAG TPA: L,D-transpeptidase family protein [Thermoanaerobaculia bacterium]|jgi:murein L,D-transpeptidase YcbB/YkuD
MRKALLVLLLVSGNLMAQTVDVAPATPVAQRVRAIVEAGRIDDASFGTYTDDVRSFYAPNGFALAWTRNGRPTAQAAATINLFERADAKGLRPFDYAGGQWQQRLAALRGDDALARFDVAMTVAAMRYASDLRVGRVNPKSVRFDYSVQAKQVYLAGVVAQMANGDANAIVAKLEPQSDEYRRLVTALATWRGIAAQPDVQLPVVTKLTRGATYEALPRLAEKLRRFGDLAADAKVLGTTYDGAIVDAVKHFQSRHGLHADGVVSKRTFAALNVPAAHRVRQIELALERARWMPEITAPASIVVNIPEFRLEARGTETLSMRVVVGKASSTQTPVFGGDIKHVVFRPYWSVPPSIQRGEIVPKLAKDRGYLAKHNYEVVDGAGRSLGSSVSDQTYQRLRDFHYTVRQKPGTSNALGLMKFLFPNDNNVYLHSTPQQSLFARERRDFSHGCVRVEDPVALAAWTLKNDPKWSEEKIRATIKGDRDDIYVKLAQPVPVVILYTTAVARANGDVHFFDDIYGHDARLTTALETGVSVKPEKVLIAAASAKAVTR